MAKRPRKPRSGPEASDGSVKLREQIREMQEQLDFAYQFHEAYIESQRALEASREQYADLYDSAPVGYLTLDGLGVICEINLTAARMLGKDRAAILGRPFRLFVSRADDVNRAVLHHLSSLRHGKSQVVTELMLAGEDENSRAVELRTVRSQIDSEAPRAQLYYSVLTDISERRAAEKALRESEEKYRHLFENMTEEVHYWRLIRDESGQIKTWQLIDINRSGLEGWGKTKSETVGKTADEIFPGATAHFMPIVQKTMAEGLPQMCETCFQPLGYHLRFTCVPMGECFITTGSDISEIKKAEEILKTSNADLERRVVEQTRVIRRGFDAIQAERHRLYDVLETLPVMICLRTPDHHIAFANRSFRDKFAESYDQHCDEHRFGLAAPFSFCESYEVLKTGRPHSWEFVAQDGSVIDTHAFPFADTDGAKMVLEMGIDISDRRLAEKELRKAQKVLEDRASQLRALATELTLTQQRERKRLALVLHDGLQQLLVAAKYQLALFGRDMNVAESVAEVSNLIDDCIETFRSLTAELSPPILHEGGLIPALEWLAQWMHEKHGLCVALKSQGHKRTPEGIAVLLFQSIRELLFNVIKHAGTREARIGIRQYDGFIQVEVADEGVGFDPGQNAKHANGESSGMGLFNIRERLGYFGGTMKIDAAPGRGAIFTLTAPMAGASERMHIPDAGASVSYICQTVSTINDDGKIRVVLVDDHRVMRQGLASLLATQSDILIVGEASDGRSAIDLIRETRPVVVLMDINMSGMDGIEATRQIHEQMPEVKIIGLSMFNEKEQAVAIMAAGASGYLVKSDAAEAVIEAIRSCSQVAPPQQ